MKAAIENFAKADGDNKLLVLGAMAELGKESIEEHKVVIETISHHQWKNVLLVGGDFIKTSHLYLSFSTPEEAGNWLKTNNIQNAWLLIKGSRSMQMEKVLNYLS
jgi:UDP-N-acetylmuramoyl-tripeptide--D-alanyl-D-alanine ligase